MNDDIWKQIQKWYTDNGISTEQFFNGNSTEVGRDEMLMDFASRAITTLNQPTIQREMRRLKYNEPKKETPEELQAYDDWRDSWVKKK